MNAPIKLPPTLAYIVGVPVAPRTAVEQLIQRAIDELDELDGDPDLEDATDAEDEGVSPAALAFADGPGCSISDPDHEHDGREHEDGY